MPVMFQPVRLHEDTPPVSVSLTAPAEVEGFRGSPGGTADPLVGVVPHSLQHLLSC